MTQQIYGYGNVAFHNRKPEGDDAWFATREERDKELAFVRSQAIAEGLSESAARHGLYPMTGNPRMLPGVWLADADAVIGPDGTW
jgi:hypothetical protein